MDWATITQMLLEIYPVRMQSRGHKAYCPLFLFKTLLVGQWHELSGRELESCMGYAFGNAFLRFSA